MIQHKYELGNRKELTKRVDVKKLETFIYINKISAHLVCNERLQNLSHVLSQITSAHFV